MILNEEQIGNVLNAIALAAMVQARGEQLHDDGPNGELGALYKALVQPGRVEDPWQDLAYGASMLSQGLLNLVTGLLSHLHGAYDVEPLDMLGAIGRQLQEEGRI